MLTNLEAAGTIRHYSFWVNGGLEMTRARAGWLAGTTALATGASQRLGRAVANADAREGYLQLDGRRPEPLERVREEVEALGARAVAGAADAGDAAAAMEPLDMKGDHGGIK